MRTILPVFRYIRRYQWLAVETVGFAVLATLIIIVFPTVTQRAIEPGQTIAPVGATGAGKSTLVNLLLRFYELSPGGGDILIDDRPIRDLSKHAIRDATGFVSQESFLFNGTIRENLLFARPGASESEIWNALRAANAEEFGNHEQLLELDGVYAKLCQSGLFFAKEAAELEHTALLEGNLYLSNPLKSARLE